MSRLTASYGLAAFYDKGCGVNFSAKGFSQDKMYFGRCLLVRQLRSEIGGNPVDVDYERDICLGCCLV